jgi:hypothetical protein
VLELERQVWRLGDTAALDERWFDRRGRSA